MLRSTFASLREYLTPLPQSSKFQKTGEITPEEFVRAGDYLVFRFPTWSWAAASPSKRRDFLPEDKQVLVTRHVPCMHRIETDEINLTEEDEWVVGTSQRSAKDANSWANNQEILEIDDLDAETDANDAETVEDLDALGIQEADSAAAGSAAQERTYNVYITYSASYRVPRAYLSGFDADGAPLPPKLMFEDIVPDYRDKTVTIEQAPFESNLTLISIHPCRHAGVMRMLLDRAEEKQMEETSADEWEEVPTDLGVDKYLVVFLKFIASVTPTIEYDFTMSA